MSDIDHTRDCILPSDGKAEGLVRASELFALAAERDALRAEIERLKGIVDGFSLDPDHIKLREENEMMRAALERIANDSEEDADMNEWGPAAIARAALEEKP